MKHIALLTFILIFNFSFSQKKELRKAQKLYDAGDISGASQLLLENQSILENADKKVRYKGFFSCPVKIGNKKSPRLNSRTSNHKPIHLCRIVVQI